MKLKNKMSTMQPVKKLGFGYYFVWILYTAIFVPTVYYAIVALLPCESNFEGGCGMGKSLVLLLTLISAVVLWAIGLGLSSFDTTGNKSRWFGKAALYLPATYLCLMLGLLAIAFLGLAAISVIIFFVLFVMFVYKLK